MQNRFRCCYGGSNHRKCGCCTCWYRGTWSYGRYGNCRCRRSGSNEADTYVFAKGHGQDTVSDYGYLDIHIDTLLFEDALLENAVFSRDGNHLLIQAYGGEDKVSVENYFSGGAYRYNQFSFEDATVKIDAAMNISIV